MPQTNIPGPTVPVKNLTGVTLIGGRGVVCSADGDNCVETPAAGGGIDGVLAYDVADGELGAMFIYGEVDAEVAAAVNPGDPVAVTATGIFTAVATTNHVAGVVRKALGAAGTTRVLIQPGRPVTP